jgi:hypothetical protein
MCVGLADWNDFRTLEEKFQLNLPDYHGYDQIVELLSNEEAPEGSRY